MRVLEQQENDMIKVINELSAEVFIEKIVN